MQYITCILILYLVGMWAILNNPLTPQITDKKGDQMSIPLPKNTADWIHLVIFETMKSIWLTRSTFKVTTYRDFSPYLESFQTMETFQTMHGYLQDFKVYLNDPSYMWYLTNNSSQANPILLHNNSLMQ